MAEIFGLDGLFILFLFLMVPAFEIWMIVDAAVRPALVWERARQQKTLWIVLMSVGFFLPLIGLILAVVYCAAIRPKVRAQERSLPAPPPPRPGWWLASDGNWYPPDARRASP